MQYRKHLKIYKYTIRIYIFVLDALLVFEMRFSYSIKIKSYNGI